MKKVLANLMVVIMALALYSVPVFARELTDIASDDYFNEAVTTLSEAGIINGYEDGTFKPQNYVTRAEMVAIICRAMGKEEAARREMGYTTDFSKDVPSNHWASGYVVFAVANDIILGDGNGKFRPEDYVRYEEVVKMIVCAIGIDENIDHDPNDWAAGYLRRGETHGFTNNYVTCKRGDYVNRADVAVLLYHAIKDKLHSITFIEDGVGTSNFDEVNKVCLAGTMITLKVTPKEGYVFMGWDSDGGEFTLRNNELTEFIMPRHDVIIRPIFFRAH